MARTGQGAAAPVTWLSVTHLVTNWASGHAAHAIAGMCDRPSPAFQLFLAGRSPCTRQIRDVTQVPAFPGRSNSQEQTQPMPQLTLRAALSASRGNAGGRREDGGVDSVGFPGKDDFPD